MTALGTGQAHEVVIYNTLQIGWLDLGIGLQTVVCFNSSLSIRSLLSCLQLTSTWGNEDNVKCIKQTLRAEEFRLSI
jgi:hypothetical protein